MMTVARSTMPASGGALAQHPYTQPRRRCRPARRELAQARVDRECAAHDAGHDGPVPPHRDPGSDLIRELADGGPAADSPRALEHLADRARYQQATEQAARSAWCEPGCDHDIAELVGRIPAVVAQRD